MPFGEGSDEIREHPLLHLPERLGTSGNSGPMVGRAAGGDPYLYAFDKATGTEGVALRRVR